MTSKMGFGYGWKVIASASPAAYCFKLMRDKSDYRYYTHILSIIATAIQIIRRRRNNSGFNTPASKTHLVFYAFWKKFSLFVSVPSGHSSFMINRCLIAVSLMS